MIGELEKLLEVLAAKATRKEELATAKEIRRAALEQRIALEGEIGEAEARLKEYVGELNRFEVEPTGIVKQRLQEAESELADVRCSITVIHTDIGALQARLADLETSKLEAEKLEREMAPLTKKSLRWDGLVKAFGRNGIPAFIIENAVPEL